MWEKTRWRHRVTDGVIEVVEKFYGYCRVLDLKTGSTYRIDNTLLLQDYKRLNTD